MASGKSFTPNAPRAGTATAAPASRPAFTRSGNGIKTARPRDDRPSPKPIMDAISGALGDHVFGQGHFFEGQTKPDTTRHLFRRWYPRIRVLIDEFGTVTDAVRREVSQKISAVEAYNAEHTDAQIGYIPYVTGAQVDCDSIEYAKIGGCVPLAEKEQQWR